MAAFADFDAYVAAFTNPRDNVVALKTMSLYVSASHAARYGFSSWRENPLQGAAPTTAAVPTSATLGAFPFDNEQLRNSSGATQSYCVGGTGKAHVSTAVWVCDRLSHQGGLAGNLNTAQTTNLPTAALTRYTSGVGVFAAVEIYTQLGSTPSAVTCVYTNQAGTGSQTSLSNLVPADAPPGAMIPISLAAGDTGIRSVESLTLANTTGSAGAFGVTLYKPLFMIDVDDNETSWDPLVSGAMYGGLPEIVDDACLFFISRSVALEGGVTRNLTAEFRFAEV